MSEVFLGECFLGLAGGCFGEVGGGEVVGEVEVLLGGCLFGADGGQFLKYPLSQLHEITAEYIVESGSVGWISHQYLLDQTDGLVGSVHCFGDGIRALFDALVSGVGVFGLERRDPEVESVKDHSYTPDIDFEVVASAVEYFRRDVVGSAADCAFALAGELQFGGKSEVSDFDVELGIDKDVA